MASYRFPSLRANWLMKKTTTASATKPKREKSTKYLMITAKSLLFESSAIR